MFLALGALYFRWLSLHSNRFAYERSDRRLYGRFNHCLWLLAVFCALCHAVVQPGRNHAPADKATDDAGTNSQVKAEDSEKSPTEGDEEYSHIRHDAVGQIRKDAVLRTNDSAEAVSAIGGSAIVHGRFAKAVVAIGGDVEMMVKHTMWFRFSEE